MAMLNNQMVSWNRSNRMWCSKPQERGIYQPVCKCVKFDLSCFNVCLKNGESCTNILMFRSKSPASQESRDVANFMKPKKCDGLSIYILYESYKSHMNHIHKRMYLKNNHINPIKIRNWGWLLIPWLHMVTIHEVMATWACLDIFDIYCISSLMFSVTKMVLKPPLTRGICAS